MSHLWYSVDQRRVLACCELCKLQDMTHAVGSLHEAAIKPLSFSCPLCWASSRAKCCLAAQHYFLQASQVKPPECRLQVTAE